MKLGALLGRLTGGGGNYAYVVARVRAKKPKLIPKGEYTKLLAMDVNEIARNLEEGDYKKEVLALAGKSTGALLVEQATRLNLAHTYQDIIGMSKGELQRMVLLYLQRYDVYNVKTVLRGRFSNASDEEITRNLIPAGALTTADLEELLRLGNLNEVVEALRRTPYGAALEEQTGTVQRLTEIENTLDREYYKRLLGSVQGTSEAKKAFRAFIATEIDAVNVKTLLRLRVAGVEDDGGLFVDGGRELAVDNLRRLLRASPGDVVAEIEQTRLSDAIEGIRATVNSGNLGPAVSALDRYVVEFARPFGQRYPLSILPIIDYVLRKRREVDNLRIIAYGKANGLKESTLEELVVV